jgi:transcriptional regulator with XRE-family HTH domain
MIDYYERRSPNPALAFIERAAQALGFPLLNWISSKSGNVSHESN